MIKEGGVFPFLWPLYRPFLSGKRFLNLLSLNAPKVCVPPQPKNPDCLYFPHLCPCPANKQAAGGVSHSAGPSHTVPQGRGRGLDRGLDYGSPGGQRRTPPLPQCEMKWIKIGGGGRPAGSVPLPILLLTLCTPLPIFPGFKTPKLAEGGMELGVVKSLEGSTLEEELGSPREFLCLSSQPSAPIPATDKSSPMHVAHGWLPSLASLGLLNNVVLLYGSGQVSMKAGL